MSLYALLLFPLLCFSVFTEQSNDVPITLSMAGSSSSGSGVEACMINTEQQVKARINAIKTSGGLEFFRHSVNDVDEKCFTKSVYQKIISTSTDFLTCMEETVALEYNSFTFDDGLCTAYKTWRPKEMSSCSAGETGMIAYVVQGQLSDFEISIDLELTADVVIRDDVDLDLLAYHPCIQEESNGAAEYVITSEGTELGRVPYVHNEKQTFSLNESTVCGEESPVIKITTVDASGEALHEPVTLEDFNSVTAQKELTAQIVARGVTSVDLTMLATDPCCTITEYTIKFNGSPLATVPFLCGVAQEYTLRKPLLCSNDPIEIEVTASDADGNDMSNTVALNVTVNDDGRRVLMDENGQCLALFDGMTPKLNYEQSKQHCTDLFNTTLYTYHEYAGFFGNLVSTALTDNDDADEDFFVFLINVDGAFTWQGGLPTVESFETGRYWHSSANDTVGDCAVSLESLGFKLIRAPCTNDYSRVVCYEFISYTG